METVETTPKEQIEAWAERHGVTMDAKFIPFSQSRNKEEKSPSLNWRITLRKVFSHSDTPAAFLTTDYSAGCGHCKAYQASIAELGHKNSMLRDGHLRNECETGTPYGGGKPHMPSFADVLYSLSMDYSVIDAGGFEEWASEYGYETDSRKAEAIYRACLDIALKLRATLGDAAMAELSDACQDY